MKKRALITGATGLLGSWLICELLRSKKYDQVIAVVRASTPSSALSRLQGLIKLIPHNLPVSSFSSLKVICGDVDRPMFGLSKNKPLCEVTDFFHSAAIAEFEIPLKKIRVTNVGGTRNVCEVAVKNSKVSKEITFHHISTVAVAGNFKGTFYEHYLNVGQKFNNSYEQSKFEAEKEVLSYSRKIGVRIYRPAIITGDSRTGLTTNFKMFYQPVHFMSKNLFSILPANPSSRLSFVPVDFVARAIQILSSKKFEEPQSFHLANPHETTIVEFVANASRLLGFKMPTMVPVAEIKRTEFSPAQWKLLKPFIPYFNYETRFNSTKTLDILNAEGFDWPVMDGGKFRTLYNFCLRSKFINAS